MKVGERFAVWLAKRPWILTTVVFAMLAVNIGAVVHAEVSKRRALAGGVVKVRCVCEAP